MTRLLKTCLAILSASASFSAFADSQLVQSYSFDMATGCDNRCYSDFSNTKLTDGAFGSGTAQYNASEGWVGWNIGWSPTKAPVNIDFTFSSKANISSILIGSMTNDPFQQPLLTIFQNTSNGWELVAANAMNVAGTHTYSFDNLAIHSDKVRLSASSSNNWVLVDEVSFTAAPVPEPETYSLILTGLGVLGFMVRRRKDKFSPLRK